MTIITIEIGLTRVNFLDITLDLETGLYKPFRKPGDRPLYVSAHSNHPPQILKNLPHGIERRLSDNSANQAIFEAAVPPYQKELDRCGYTHKLKYKPIIEPNQPKKAKKNRKKPITWFNPPFCRSIKTKIGQKILKLIDECFTKDHPLRPICKRNTMK